jgi:hypothetical protein
MDEWRVVLGSKAKDLVSFDDGGGTAGGRAAPPGGKTSKQQRLYRFDLNSG